MSANPIFYPTRKIPRIIARSSAPRSSGSSSASSLAEESEPTLPKDLDMELYNEDIIVQDGVMVKTGSPENLPPPHRFSTERGVVPLSRFFPMLREPPRASVIDMVEHYRCRFCPSYDRIFLTPSGLLAHTKDEHPKMLPQVQREVDSIRIEWEKKEQMRIRQRREVQLGKLKEMSMTRELYAQRRISSFEFCGDEAEQFVTCNLCSTFINVNNPKARESHLRAHKKNDELKETLILTFGADIVMQLTCQLCQLVFMDDKKLLDHNKAMHARKRKYVCKWCGYVAITVSELNGHKADAMARALTRKRLGINKRRCGVFGALGAEKKYGRVGVASPITVQQHNDTDMPCRTQCEDCGLRLVRPSLLVRHMSRVHSKQSFSCTVETTGLPPFQIKVNRDNIKWICCEEVYIDRYNFLCHRRFEHMAKFVEEYMAMNSKDSDQMEEDGDMMEMVQDDHHMGGHLLVDENMMMVQDEMSMDYLMVMDGSEMLSADKGRILRVEYGADQSVGGEGLSTCRFVNLIISSGDGEVTETMELAEEQYEQLRLQFGDRLEHLQLVIVDRDDYLQDQMLQLPDGMEEAGLEGGEIEEMEQQQLEEHEQLLGPGQL